MRIDLNNVLLFNSPRNLPWERSKSGLFLDLEVLIIFFGISLCGGEQNNRLFVSYNWLNHIMFQAFSEFSIL